MKSTSAVILLATTIGSATASHIRRGTDFDVLVGSDPTGNEKGIEFFPNGPSVAVDWKLIFYFMPGKHSVVESTFEKPCEPKEGGVNSGLFDVDDRGPITLDALPAWSLDFTRPETRFFFDEASGKCSEGAVFMTVPTQNKPLAQFIENAKSGGAAEPTGTSASASAPDSPSPPPASTSPPLSTSSSITNSPPQEQGEQGGQREDENGAQGTGINALVLSMTLGSLLLGAFAFLV